MFDEIEISEKILQPHLNFVSGNAMKKSLKCTVLIW